ncbi:MAG: DUF554 domain-containing protein [Firmicutes bacterium]|nr:DUF554 domain-containing protein [Bacillota bacterium]
MTGTIVNTLAIIVGATLGLLLRSRLPSRVSKTIVHGVGTVTVVLGIDMGLKSQNILIPLLSLVVGGAIGEAIDIQNWLESISSRVESRFKGEKNQFSQGLITASLVYLVGPMAILGAINDGLSGDYQILLTKSMLDGITSIALGSTLGVGVAFSAIPVLIYQGTLSLAADMARTLFTEPVVLEMTATGGFMVLAIGLNILEVTKIRVGNLLPGIVICILLVQVLMALNLL